MDDLNLIWRSKEQLTNEIQIIKTISYDIKTKFGLEKCDKICLKVARSIENKHVENTVRNDIKELDSIKAYKYLGTEQNRNIEYKNEKERLKGYTRRLFQTQS
jgi:hypothetical protein